MLTNILLYCKVKLCMNVQSASFLSSNSVLWRFWIMPQSVRHCDVVIFCVHYYGSYVICVLGFILSLKCNFVLFLLHYYAWARRNKSFKLYMKIIFDYDIFRIVLDIWQCFQRLNSYNDSKSRTLAGINFVCLFVSKKERFEHVFW